VDYNRLQWRANRVGTHEEAGNPSLRPKDQTKGQQVNQVAERYAALRASMVIKAPEILLNDRCPKEQPTARWQYKERAKTVGEKRRNGRS
jgi:hypothetical protein